MTVEILSEEDKLKKYFHPESVAVIGASANPAKIGYRVLGNILFGQIPSGENAEQEIQERVEKKQFAYPGKVYPVNIKGGEILGLKVYKSLLDIPGRVDMAVICVPPKFVKEVITQCGKKGCYAATVITAGFGESGNVNMEKEMIYEARKWGVRIIGPNCFGVFNTYLPLNATFARDIPLKGPISFISQSGAVGASAIIYGLSESIGFRYFVSIGNKADVTDADLIRIYGKDPKTKAIALYVESFPDGRDFYEAAKEVSWHVPIVALKAGRTSAGQKAASSHTGAIASSDVAVEAAFRQAGIFRAYTFYGLLDAARALGYQNPPLGENVAILTNAGGAGVITADYMNDLGMKLAELTPETIKRISQVCPPTWSHNNPVDVVGDADVERFINTLEAMVEAPEIDAIIILVVPTGTLEMNKLPERIVEIANKTHKPMTASFVGVISDVSEDYLEQHGIPTYSFPERAAFGMYALVERGKYLRKIGVM